MVGQLKKMTGKGRITDIVRKRSKLRLDIDEIFIGLTPSIIYNIGMIMIM